MRVSLWAKSERFSVEDNGFLGVPHCSKLGVTITEMICEPGQRDGSLGVARWAKVKCFTIKHDRLVDAAGSPSAETWWREILPVKVTVQLVGASFQCSARCQKSTSTFRIHPGSPNFIRHSGLRKRSCVVCRKGKLHNPPRLHSSIRLPAPIRMWEARWDVLTRFSAFTLRNI